MSQFIFFTEREATSVLGIHGFIKLWIDMKNRKGKKVIFWKTIAI